MHLGETTTTSTTTTSTTSTTTTQNLETCNFCINFHVDIFVDFGGEVLNVLTCFIVLYSVCSVDGIAGDGTAQGNCNYDQMCHADGLCKGTLCQSF